MDREAAAKILQDALGGNAASQGVTSYIDTGYQPLNAIMCGDENGGLPQARMVEMFGESSTGKTALATAWMAQTQKMGGIAGFIDWERSFAIELAGEFGMSDHPSQWIYRRPRTWEEGNMDAAAACRTIRENKLIAPDAPILFVFDSIAAAVPGSSAGKDFNELNMNDTTALARITSTTLKSMALYSSDFNATFLYLNQIRLKPGVVYGDPRTTPGGKAMEFFATCRLALGRSKIMEGTGADKEFVGQKITIQCVKSKLTRPFQECSLRLAYDDLGIARFDTTTSLIEHAVDNKLITYSKPHITWTDGKKYFVKALATKIEAEGLQDQLKAIVYPPAVLAKAA